MAMHITHAVYAVLPIKGIVKCLKCKADKKSGSSLQKLRGNELVAPAEKTSTTLRSDQNATNAQQLLGFVHILRNQGWGFPKKITL